MISYKNKNYCFMNNARQSKGGKLITRNLLKSAQIILANRTTISLSVSAYSLDICILSIDKHLSCLMRSEQKTNERKKNDLNIYELNFYLFHLPISVSPFSWSESSRYSIIDKNAEPAARFVKMGRQIEREKERRERLHYHTHVQKVYRTNTS